MLYFLLGMAAITGYLAMRTRFPLFRFGAAIPWIGIIAYIVANYDGENWTVIAILGCIVMMCALPLMQLGSDIKRQTDIRSGLVIDESSGFKFKMPGFLQDNDTPERRKQRTEQSNDEYRETLHRALHPRRRR